jgi:hypothetical protein
MGREDDEESSQIGTLEFMYISTDFRRIWIWNKASFPLKITYDQVRLVRKGRRRRLPLRVQLHVQWRRTCHHRGITPCLGGP